MEMLLPYQPESNSRLLKYSFVLYAASFKRVFWLALLLAIITFIPRLLSTAIGQDIFFNIQPFSPYRLWLFLVNVIGLMFFIAILWNMHCITRDVVEPFIEDFVVGLKKVFYVLVATVIQFGVIFIVTALVYGIQIFLHRHNVLFSNSILGIILTFCVLFLPAILILYVETLFVFLVPIIAIENKGIIGAIERSIYLAWNHWWRVFSLQLTPWLCFLIVLFILRYALKLDIHIYFIEYGPHPLWASIVQLIIFALFVPWVAALLIVQIRDLELRKHITQKDKAAI